MTELDIDYNSQDGIGTLIFERPPVNALRYQDIEQLSTTIKRLPENEEKVIIIKTGGEDVFLAGHDVNQFVDYNNAKEPEHTSIYMDFVKELYEFPLPIIAVIDGPAVGAGMIFVSLCDLRVATPQSYFALPEIDVGVIGGYAPIRRLLPDAISREVTYTGGHLKASRALELGFLNTVSDDISDVATNLATDIASKSGEAVKAAKKSIIEHQSANPIDGYRREREYNAELRKGEESGEAAMSFIDGREPEFDS